MRYFILIRFTFPVSPSCTGFQHPSACSTSTLMEKKCELANLSVVSDLATQPRMRGVHRFCGFLSTFVGFDGSGG
ncbi:hypothetical protein pipiens_012956 [Culex pipiens pipiens]|uniref:Secreted protein n=1 Tax=Culex pipiens pipiens TaxID=38569 RepID=A0ABD1D0G5_CULPP